MIIPNKLLKLEYDPIKDILFVEWPDFDYHMLPELQQILTNITETSRHYDINYLLIDSRTTAISIKDSDYELIARKFAQDLATTRLKKVARITTNNRAREDQVKLIKEKVKLQMEVESFETMDEAIDWFKQ